MRLGVKEPEYKIIVCALNLAMAKEAFLRGMRKIFIADFGDATSHVINKRGEGDSTHA